MTHDSKGTDAGISHNVALLGQIIIFSIDGVPNVRKRCILFITAVAVWQSVFNTPHTLAQMLNESSSIFGGHQDEGGTAVHNNFLVNTSDVGIIANQRHLLEIELPMILIGIDVMEREGGLWKSELF
jgi:hypothetical protein